MVRAAKTVSTSSASVESVAPSTSNVTLTAAPVKTPRAKKAVKAVVETPVVAASADVAANVLAPAASLDAPTAVSVISARMIEFNAKLQQLMSLFSSVKNDFKNLEKSIAREMKNAQKASSKKRRNNGNRKPSGFIKPTLISNELASFLGKSSGTEMARTDVSKEINSYIQSNGLQDKTNGRKINPDQKLALLLKLGQSDELTYFNLQRYMKHHFVKTGDVVTDATRA